MELSTNCICEQRNSEDFRETDLDKPMDRDNVWFKGGGSYYSFDRVKINTEEFNKLKEMCDEVRPAVLRGGERVTVLLFGSGPPDHKPPFLWVHVWNNENVLIASCRGWEFSEAIKSGEIKQIEHYTATVTDILKDYFYVQINNPENKSGLMEYFYWNDPNVLNIKLSVGDIVSWEFVPIADLIQGFKVVKRKEEDEN